MATILRGLLQFPVSTTLASDEQTGSAETLHRHQQHCSNQWDYSNNRRRHEPCKYQAHQTYTNNHNSVCNIKMEENISEQTFWRNSTTEEEPGAIKIKQEDTSDCIDGVYYSYTIELGKSDWIQQEQSKQCQVSPVCQKSPVLDTKNRHFLGKYQKKFSVMNVYTALDTPSPQAFSPNGVPDFSQEGFITSCFGAGYGYDGSFSQFDDSLSSPQDPESIPYFGTKLDPMVDDNGDLSLSDCGGMFGCYTNDVNLEADWLHESMSLPTPDEQDGDVTFTPPMPYTSITLPITPNSSYPPTPLSTSPSSDVEEVLSLFSDQNSEPTSYPSEYLPFGQSFDSFDSTTDDSQFSSPSLTPVGSPFPTTPIYSQETPLPSPLPLDENPRVAIKDLLAENSGTESSSQERKRKAPKSSSGDAPKPKRRLSVTAKKERKREQNKCAALRYRQKKKEEKQGCFSKLDVLEAKNADLKKKVSTITAEIEYLKKLWSEVNAKRLSQQQQVLSVC